MVNSSFFKKYQKYYTSSNCIRYDEKNVGKAIDFVSKTNPEVVRNIFIITKVFIFDHSVVLQFLMIHFHKIHPRDYKPTELKIKVFESQKILKKYTLLKNLHSLDPLDMVLGI